MRRADPPQRFHRSQPLLQRTRRVADIWPGPLSSNPGDGSGIVRSGDLLYFRANDNSGEELWAHGSALFDDGFESGDTTAWSAP